MSQQRILIMPHVYVKTKKYICVRFYKPIQFDIKYQFLVMFGVLSVLSRYISDRALVMAGLGFMVIALSWHTATIPTFSIGTSPNSIVFWC